MKTGQVHQVNRIGQSEMVALRVIDRHAADGLLRNEGVIADNAKFLERVFPLRVVLVQVFSEALLLARLLAGSLSPRAARLLQIPFAWEKMLGVKKRLVHFQ